MNIEPLKTKQKQQHTQRFHDQGAVEHQQEQQQAQRVYGRTPRETQGKQVRHPPLLLEYHSAGKDSMMAGQLGSETTPKLRARDGSESSNSSNNRNHEAEEEETHCSQSTTAKRV